jgi:hypothetical protein
LNPGSIGDSFHPTYGIITLTSQQLDACTVFLK